MKIAIHIPPIVKSDGGSYYYVEKILDFFNNNKGKHEFVFFSTDQSVLSQNSNNNEQKFFLFDLNKVQNALNKEIKNRGWKRLLWFLSFIEYRFKIRFYSFFKQQLTASIKSLNDEVTEKEFTDFVAFHHIDCVYYTHPFYCFNTDIPFICTVWDLGHITQSVFPEITGERQYEKREDFFRKVLPRAFRIVRESECGKNELKQYYNIDDNKIIVLPLFPGSVVRLGIKPEEISRILSSLGLKARKFIFYPAQFWPHKNHYNLLLALNHLKTTGVSITMVFTGSDKGNLDYVKKIIQKYNLEQYVKIPGFVDDEVIYALYKEALAMVYPSFLGPTNLPIIESLALGCPLLCSDLEGHREQAGDAAIYFDPANYLNIAESLITIINNEFLRQDLINKGIEQYKQVTESAMNFHRLTSAFDELESKRKCRE